ncbi:MAG: endopeptidase La [Betaproteobacteria bacterium]|nr:endopeptidase La [Betaproteobacteria bacterium]
MNKPSDDNFKKAVLPVLPLRDLVVFPGVVVPLYVGRDFSMAAVEKAQKEGTSLLLVAQRVADIPIPERDQLHDIGCLARVIQSVSLADGSVKALVEGLQRIRIGECQLPVGRNRVMSAEFAVVSDSNQPSESTAKGLRNQIIEYFVELSKHPRTEISSDTVDSARKIDELGRLADFIAYAYSIDVLVRQEMIEMADVRARAEKLIEILGKDLEVCRIERSLRGRVKSQIEKNHREYYLNEKAKAIQSELGDDGSEDLEDLKKQIEAAGMPEAVLNKCKQELRKLSIVPAMAPESAVLRNYLETLAKLPWSKRSPVNPNLIKARQVLDEDHYGLEKVKERIIEHLAVQQRVKQPQGTILCIVGAPGVGKTSLGRSVARATGREYVRMALGGLRDEAEIRGHRRTYVASMPGRILQCMTRAGTRNPVFMLDEIDKMGYDFRGDPAAALLEVLDPEQNKAFMDHYAEVDYDLSEVFFIATSNSYNIPPALLDRLEIIPVAGYTEPEKLMIAKRHLIPKSMEQTGIPDGRLKIGEGSLREIVRCYTREAGVRQLERELRKICRKVVTENAMAVARRSAGKAPRKKASEAFAAKTITPAKVNKLLGVKRYMFGKAKDEGKVGQVVGLAWTETGGDLLNIESVKMPGSGKIVRTGKLGEVMRESIEASYSVVRARAQALELPEDFPRRVDLHIHLPEGAIPKDGPSAGIGVVCAMISALTGVPARADIALTGEITLRGEVLPVGGIKEKLLAAVRGEIKQVLLPEDNRKDIEEINPELLASIEIRFVKWIDEAIEQVLGVKRQMPERPRRPRRQVASVKPPAVAN